MFKYRTCIHNMWDLLFLYMVFSGFVILQLPCRLCCLLLTRPRDMLMDSVLSLLRSGLEIRPL